MADTIKIVAEGRSHIRKDIFIDKPIPASIPDRRIIPIFFGFSRNLSRKYREIKRIIKLRLS